jgi:hypothetical protein
MEFLTWDTLGIHLAKRNPCLLPIGGTRNLRIAYIPGEEALALLLPLNAEIEVPPSLFAEIDTVVRYEKGQPIFQVSVSRKELFPAFHQLAVLIARKFESPQATALGAFQEAVDSWQALVQRKPLLSEEQQLGLFGELAVLEALILRDGLKALECWTAYAQDKSERHDFRIGTTEIEVKSTRSRKRLHVIHGLTQMVESPGRQLYVLSLKFEHGGNSGRSLSDRVNDVRKRLKPDASYNQLFEEKLLSANYRDSDSTHYSAKLITADYPHLIAVDDQFPRITESLLANGLGTKLISRIGEVTYRVDLDGLGWAPSMAEYQALLGVITIE